MYELKSLYTALRDVKKWSKLTLMLLNLRKKGCFLFVFELRRIKDKKESRSYACRQEWEAIHTENIEGINFDVILCSGW